MIKIEVMNRTEALDFASTYQGKPVGLISVSTPSLNYARYLSATQSVQVLHLSFHDVDEPSPDYIHFTTHHAARIADFIVRLRLYGVDYFIVQCDAGQSRSAGIAQAICESFGMSYDSIVSNRTLTPNMLCYRKTLNAFQSIYRAIGIYIVRKTTSLTLEKIGSFCNLTRERVRQILNEFPCHNRALANYIDKLHEQGKPMYDIIHDIDRTLPGFQNIVAIQPPV